MCNLFDSRTVMSGKSVLWRTEEICLLEIWADENLKCQMENTYKTADIFHFFQTAGHIYGIVKMPNTVILALTPY